MLFGGKKERLTEKLITRHIKRVGKVVEDMNKATKEYCTDCAEFDERAKKVIEGESRADEIRREIEQELYDGAFMPAQRGDYSAMVEAVDKVANQCEAVAQFLLLTRPALSAETRDGLVKIMEETVRGYVHINEICERFDDGQRVVQLVHQVEDSEKAVDKLFAGIVRKLFLSDLDLAQKLHVKMLLDRAASISNRIEDASDYFLILVSKRPQ